MRVMRQIPTNLIQNGNKMSGTYYKSHTTNKLVYFLIFFCLLSLMLYKAFPEAGEDPVDRVIGEQKESQDKNSGSESPTWKLNVVVPEQFNKYFFKQKYLKLLGGNRFKKAAKKSSKTVFIASLSLDEFEKLKKGNGEELAKGIQITGFQYDLEVLKKPDDYQIIDRSSDNLLIFNIKADRLKAVFNVHLSENLPTSYRIGKQVINPGTNAILIPFGKMNKEISINAIDSEYKDCDIKENGFTTKNALYQKEIELRPPDCPKLKDIGKITIVVPEEFKEINLENIEPTWLKGTLDILKIRKKSTSSEYETYYRGKRPPELAFFFLNSNIHGNFELSKSGENYVLKASDEIKVEFLISLDDTAPCEFRVSGEEDAIAPGTKKSIIIPWDELGKSIELTAENTTYKDCNLTQTLSFDNRKNSITHKPNCNRNIEIQFPAEFEKIGNLVEKLNLKDHPTVKFTKLPGPSFQAEIPAVIRSEWLQIPGFTDIEISDESATYEINPNELEVMLPVELKTSAKCSVKIIDKVIKPGESTTIKLPYSKLNTNISVEATHPCDSNCNSTKSFDLAEVIRNTPIPIDLACKPQKEVGIKIVLPKKFIGTNLAGKISITDCDSEVKLVFGKKRTFFASCPENLNVESISISGFNNIEMPQLGEEGKYWIESDKIGATFTVSLPQNAQYDYIIKGTKIFRGKQEKLTLLLRDLNKRIPIEAVDAANAPFDFFTQFNIQEIVDGGTLELSVGKKKKIPPPKAFKVTLVVPKAFKGIDLSGKIIAQGCGSFKLKPQRKRTYSSKCQRNNFPTEITIQGIGTIPLPQPRNDGKFELRFEYVTIQIKVPEQSPCGYRIEGILIKAGETKKIRTLFSKLGKPMMIKADGPEYTICNLRKTLSLKTVINQQIQFLDVPCRKFKITWPSKLPDPEFEGGNIVQRAAGEVEGIIPIDGDVELSWGKGWKSIRIPGKDLQTNEAYHIDFGKLVGRWPFDKDDPWLSQTIVREGKNPCETKPKYIIVTAKYCNDSDVCSTPYKLSIPQQPGLPDLNKAGWKDENGLPTKVVFQLEERSHNPNYKDTLSIEWPTANGVIKRNIENLPHIEVKVENSLPAKIHANIDYDPNAKILFFPNKNACENADFDNIGTMERVFIPAFLNDLTANECTWTTIVKGKKKLTPCVQARKDGNQVLFRPSAIKFSGKRKIIAIANSLLLSERGRGSAIRSALISWLRSLKIQNKSLPFNLFVVKSDYEIIELVRGEDLFLLNFESKSDTRSIVNLVNQNITFTQKGFHPFISLNSIDRRISEKKIESSHILFFTDSRNLPDPQEVVFSDIAALMGWKMDKVNVKIVTGGGCSKLEGISKDKVDLNCHGLKGNPTNQDIINLLNQLK